MVLPPGGRRSEVGWREPQPHLRGRARAQPRRRQRPRSGSRWRGHGCTWQVWVGTDWEARSVYAALFSSLRRAAHGSATSWETLELRDRKQAKIGSLIKSAAARRRPGAECEHQERPETRPALNATLGPTPRSARAGELNRLKVSEPTHRLTTR